jgi:hypothetical protein
MGLRGVGGWGGFQVYPRADRSKGTLRIYPGLALVTSTQTLAIEQKPKNVRWFRGQNASSPLSRSRETVTPPKHMHGT